MNTKLKKLVEQGLDFVRLEPKHYLPPRICHDIWEAFGKTFEPSDWRERYPLVSSGKFIPTRADKARTHLLILSAKEVLPIWHDSLIKVDLLRESMCIENIPLGEQIGTYVENSLEFPEYIVRVAEGVMDGSVELSYAIGEIATLHTILGNYMGHEQEEYPNDAYEVAVAALHALKQSVGNDPFNRGREDKDQIAPHWDMYAPGWASAIAYAGIVEDNLITGEFNAQLNLEFWVWWLTEAIPQAWQLAKDS